jgi:TDG/mug DNA glycosylase family protein
LKEYFAETINPLSKHQIIKGEVDHPHISKFISLETQREFFLAEDVLKDMLEEGLKIIFVGSAASDISASKKHYYANPRNFFWKLLYESGLTDRQLSPIEDYLLLGYGFGLTDVVKSQHGSDSKLPKESLEEGREPLKAKISRFRPEVVCFTSKNAYRAVFGKAKSYGPQEVNNDQSPIVFIVPSPSPRVRPDKLFNGKTRLQWFQELVVLIKSH